MEPVGRTKRKHRSRARSREAGPAPSPPEVRNTLVEEGISEGEVWGHTTVGHVTENFALRFFTSASGKGQEGFAYAGFYVWGEIERVNFLFQLQRLVEEEKNYVVNDKSSKAFFAKASRETNNLMYKCYAKANKELTYAGKNLATMAPLHPREVAKLIKDYWDQNYWTAESEKREAGGQVDQGCQAEESGRREDTIITMVGPVLRISS